MTEDERDEMIDLYVDDALPESLRARVEEYLDGNPDAAAAVVSLRATVARLQATPTNRPDAWFVERALDRLLREHGEAQEAPPAPKFGGAGRH
jgi:anti-sigma factor RsiW